MNETQILEKLYLKQLAHRDRARESLIEFTTYTKPDYEVEWFHRLVADKIDRWIRGEFRNLLIMKPPRHGKSELVSRRAPAYLFGKKPDTKIISCSYGADLAALMNRDVQRIIDHPAYTEIFPDTELPGKNVRSDAAGSWLRNSDLFEIVKHGGTYRCAGVGGAITGMGARYGFIDDPVKNQEAAMSRVYRDKAWDWFASTFLTRLEKDGQMLMTLTHWHHDDLGGRVMKNMKGEWEILILPAIAEGKLHPEDPRKEGEALWPSRYGVERLARTKKAIGTMWWQSLYQQKPTAEGGNMIKRNWWQFYRQLPSHFDSKITFWDMSFKDTKKADYVVGITMGKVGARKYVIDMVRARMDFPNSVRAVLYNRVKHPDCNAILIEDKANGPAVIATLKKQVPGMLAIDPKGSKESRVSSVSPQIEAGDVFLPDPEIATFNVQDLLEECSQFPKGQFDDIVDAITGCLIYWQGESAGDWGEEFETEYSTGFAGGIGEY